MKRLRLANYTLLMSIIMTSFLLKAETRQNLESRLINSNLSLAALKSEIESQRYIKKSSYSAFMPSLNAIGGIARSSIDSTELSGQLAYLQGSFNVFSGFKDKAHANLEDVKTELSQVNYEIAEKQLKENLNEIISSMLSLHKLEEILNEEVKITKAQKAMAIKKVNAGLTSQVDLYEFELRENELEIQKRDIMREHQVVHEKTNALFNEEIKDSDFDGLSFSTSENIRKNINLNSFENHPLIKKSKLDDRSVEAEKKIVSSDFWPRLDLYYSFGQITPNDTKLTYDESEVRLLMTIPLFSGFESYYKRKSAIANKQSKELNSQQVRLDIKSNFEQLKSRAEELFELNQIVDKKLSHAEKYYNLTVAEYKRGVKNSPDIVGATERYFDSKKQKINIQKELEMIQAKLNTYK